MKYLWEVECKFGAMIDIYLIIASGIHDVLRYIAKPNPYHPNWNSMTQFHIRMVPNEEAQTRQFDATIHI